MAQNSTFSPYNQDVIDMVTVAVQLCMLLENTAKHTKEELINQLVRLLPMLYLKTMMLFEKEQDIEGYLQTFVTEDDYNYVADGVAEILGNDNTYLEVFMADMQYSDTPIASTISENLADIYQELKDLAGNFQTGDEDVMRDAVYATTNSFYNDWGQKLLNALRALHCIYTSPVE